MLLILICRLEPDFRPICAGLDSSGGWILDREGVVKASAFRGLLIVHFLAQNPQNPLVKFSEQKASKMGRVSDLSPMESSAKGQFFAGKMD